MEKLVLLGAGGHCKVILDMLCGTYEIAGVTDVDLSRKGSMFYGVPVLGQDEVLIKLFKNDIKNALVALGSTGNSSLRRKLYRYADSIGFKLINAISSTSVVSPSVKMGAGNCVMDKVVIHADTYIGNNNIFNTGCIIEHDCVIGSHTHVAPGAIIAGGVKVGTLTHIGAGAVIIQGRTIGRNSIVGAGAVVIDDIPDNSVCVGAPARVIKYLMGDGNNEN